MRTVEPVDRGAARERLHRRRESPWSWWLLMLDALIVIGLGSVAAVLWKPTRSAPLADWVSSLPHADGISGFGGFCAAALLVTAVHGLVRFVRDGDTHAGIVTGLLLPVVILWDWRYLVPILLLVLVAAVITRYRPAGEPGAAFATVCVLVFPTVSTLFSLVFLEWRHR